MEPCEKELLKPICSLSSGRYSCNCTAATMFNILLSTIVSALPVIAPQSSHNSMQLALLITTLHAEKKKHTNSQRQAQ